jgi:hypothetical protein
MTLLIPLLRDEARRRGLLDEGDRVTTAVAYRLVRDMPYLRASDREPATTLREWRGTCSGKHYALKAIFEELGLPVTLLAVTHEFTPENSPWLPPHLLTEVSYAPVPDVHNFLRVQAEPPAGDWMTVDATWPSAARRLGLPANTSFQPGVDQKIACDPIEVFHVPDDEDPQAFKERLLAAHVGDQAARRDIFIRSLSEWLAANLGN